jgi:uncharacterized protein (TIGR03643 family)
MTGQAIKKEHSPNRRNADQSVSPHHISAPTEHDISEIIEMALSDHTQFKQIELLYGLKEKQVKQLMRKHLKRGSYEAWRRRVRSFSDRREHYK